jgi:hypothetical protein
VGKLADQFGGSFSIASGESCARAHHFLLIIIALDIGVSNS